MNLFLGKSFLLWLKMLTSLFKVIFDDFSWSSFRNHLYFALLFLSSSFSHFSPECCLPSSHTIGFFLWPSDCRLAFSCSQPITFSYFSFMFVILPIFFRLSSMLPPSLFWHYFQLCSQGFIFFRYLKFSQLPVNLSFFLCYQAFAIFWFSFTHFLPFSLILLKYLSGDTSVFFYYASYQTHPQTFNHNPQQLFPL